MATRDVLIGPRCYHSLIMRSSHWSQRCAHRSHCCLSDPASGPLGRITSIRPQDVLTVTLAGLRSRSGISRPDVLISVDAGFRPTLSIAPLDVLMGLNAGHPPTRCSHGNSCWHADLRCSHAGHCWHNSLGCSHGSLCWHSTSRCSYGRTCWLAIYVRHADIR